MMLHERTTRIVIARVRMALACGECLHIQHQNTTNESGLCQVVEHVPGDFFAMVLGCHLL
jgi:hypothetical protein